MCLHIPGNVFDVTIQIVVVSTLQQHRLIWMTVLETLNSITLTSMQIICHLLHAIRILLVPMYYFATTTTTKTTTITTPTPKIAIAAAAVSTITAATAALLLLL